MTGFSGFGILHHLQRHFPDRAGVAPAQQMRSTEGKWLIFAPIAGAVMQLPEFCGFSGNVIVVEEHRFGEQFLTFGG
ncbi:hypothetical protein MPLDJ20_190088 [Mesorhizobium plurifarium]|uniref:Uncharacterized protein n=1 Tax=Mesorhizobium plurifarium TaxID=69974 RepID=A0A090EZG5_MESPL|nr:hypothetical protein MPLDJ20_190088 [Mesorhizobium plurifarium]